MPALVETSTSRAHALGRRERDVQRDAPAQRVAAQREALGRARRARAATQPANVIGRSRRPPRRARGGRAPAAGSVRGRAARDHAVPGAAGAAEAVQQDDALRHRTHPMTPSHRHLRAAARVRRRAGALRDARRLHLARLALRAARADARARAAAALLLARRRALRRLLRARAGEGLGAAGGGHVHLRDGRRRAAAGGDRGARGARAAAAADAPTARRSCARTAPDRRSTS